MDIKDYFLKTFKDYKVRFDNLNDFLFVRLYESETFIAKFKLKGHSIVEIHLNSQYESDINNLFPCIYDLETEDSLCKAVNHFFNNKVTAALFEPIDRRFIQMQDANTYDNLRQYDMDTLIHLSTYPKFELSYRTCGKLYYSQFFIFDAENHPHSVFSISFLLPNYTLHILYSVELNAFVIIQDLFKSLPLDFHHLTFEERFKDSRPIETISNIIDPYWSYEILFIFTEMITKDRSLTEDMLPSIDSLDHAIYLLHMMYI